MQNTILRSLPLLALFACSKNGGNGFRLTGQLSNTNNEIIYLERLASQRPEIVDSAEIDDNGKFEFNSFRPSLGFYRVRHNQQNFAMLVLDSADQVHLTGDFADLGRTYSVTGSPETSLFQEYNSIASKREQKLDSLNNIVQEIMEPNRTDQRRLDSVTAALEGPYNAIVESSNKEMIEKIMANTDKFASVMALQGLEPDKYPHVFKALDEGLRKKYPNDPSVKMFHEGVKRVLALAVGEVAPEIRLPSPDGKEISLGELRGKIVLIDFWASWCAPCRREMPNVVNVYNKYKDKGFEIFGVSLDQEKNRWTEAIASDRMTWPQVSDLKGWQSSAARAYNVQSIPFTVLLDQEGRILAKNLRGEELDHKLAEVFSQNRLTAVN